MKQLHDEQWMKNYLQCKSFFERHGHFPKETEDKRLRSWAKSWWTRSYLKNPQLHQEKADMLTAIGFEYKGNKQ